MARLKCSVCDETFADVGREYKDHAQSHIDNSEAGGFEVIRVFSQTEGS